MILSREDNKTMIGRLYRTTLAVSLAILTVFAPVAPTFAQQGEAQTAPPAQSQSQTPVRTIQVSNENYTNGNRWFPDIIAPYKPTTVPQPVLTNAPRIEQMIQDGKLRISLQDAIDLALQNNLDIAIQRYTPWLAEANILRTMGGGASRGTLSALGNIPAQNFDPLVTSTFSMDQRTIPVNNPLTAGTGIGIGAATSFSVLNTHVATGNLQYAQGFHTGTAFSAAFNNTRASTSSTANFFSPFVTSNFIFIGNQQLLNGFGLLANEPNIRLAKLNTSMAAQTCDHPVITPI